MCISASVIYVLFTGYTITLQKIFIYSSIILISFYFNIYLNDLIVLAVVNSNNTYNFVNL